MLSANWKANFKLMTSAISESRSLKTPNSHRPQTINILNISFGILFSLLTLDQILTLDSHLGKKINSVYFWILS